MDEQVLLETRDARGVVTLAMNRPASFNALSEEMIAAMQAALDRIAGDEGSIAFAEQGDMAGGVSG